MRDRHKAKYKHNPPLHEEEYQHKLHLSLEGAKPNLYLSLEGANHHSKINLYTRGISQVRRVTTWWSISTTNNFFHKIKIL